MTTFPAITRTDAYKLGHKPMFPEGTEYIYANMTPRGSRIPDVKKVVFFGLQIALDNLHKAYQDTFFSIDVEIICAKYERRMAQIFGADNTIGSDHIRELHGLGQLPIAVKALPEGTEVPLRVPMFTIVNTDPRFFWFTNYLETIISCTTWGTITSATIALRFRRLLDRWAMKTTGSTDGVDFQGHDFSMRGIRELEGAAYSGTGHVLSFAGSDVVPAMDVIEQHYSPDNDTLLFMSVPATEHSVMCCGGQETELDTFDRLLNLFPKGIVSVVSDTWDLWGTITEILPRLKSKIMARDGKLVIRPDSGDPVKIVCGDETLEDHLPAYLGVVELLWNIFGGTVNDKGYKVLDPHIGAIYGDAITYERADEICELLEAKGFASTNIVFGVGSFTYQYQTRDVFGMAVKATMTQNNGVAIPIFKDPKTDSGLKKSAKGRLCVYQDEQGELKLLDECTELEEEDSLLQVVYYQGPLLSQRNKWEQVVARVGVRNI